MKKAFNALEQAGLSFEFHDYKKQGIDAETLKTWLAHIDQDILLNKKGTTWKKLTPEQQAYALENQEQLIQTLIASPSMIKRPVLETQKGYLVGFKLEEYQSI